MRWGHAEGFVAKQFFIDNNPLVTPLWIAGLVAAVRTPKLRALSFMCLLPTAYFMLARARFYYVAPAYPMLIALGAVQAESWLPTLRRRPRMALTPSSGWDLWASESLPSARWCHSPIRPTA